MARPSKRVSKQELRDLFNNGHYWERAQSGEFTECVTREGPISPRKRRKLSMPHGSLSQMVAYRAAGGEIVARVHQYVDPSGRIRKDSRPDPKYLLIDGEICAPLPERPECKRKPRL